ncbi:MAG: hypothetical protein QOG94_1908 [Solirubrobacteraceae bacterium]|jgi:hypothetical protein|nr:hypothetical protein [Solirubrobacteraceae bacterium]MEA2139214.1 hypothetical protein [Solirubrobacteraceae bacterium]
MTNRHFAALLGFAFVAAWIALSFGYAMLCLLGAGAFYAIAAVLEGDVDLGELQSRVTREPPGGSVGSPSASTIPRPRVR